MIPIAQSIWMRKRRLKRCRNDLQKSNLHFNAWTRTSRRPAFPSMRQGLPLNTSHSRSTRLRIVSSLILSSLTRCTHAETLIPVDRLPVSSSVAGIILALAGIVFLFSVLFLGKIVVQIFIQYDEWWFFPGFLAIPIKLFSTLSFLLGMSAIGISLEHPDAFFLGTCLVFLVIFCYKNRSQYLAEWELGGTVFTMLVCCIAMASFHLSARATETVYPSSARWSGLTAYTRQQFQQIKSGLLQFKSDLERFPHLGTEYQSADCFRDFDVIILGVSSSTNILINRNVQGPGIASPPMGIQGFADKWKGPYLEVPPLGLMRDGWGRRIRVRHFNKQLFLHSAGKDGRFESLEVVRSAQGDTLDDLVLSVSRLRF